MIEENLRNVRERIQRACDRVGRDPEEVRIMAVTKTLGAAHIREAFDRGVTLFGENRVQEGRQKAASGAFEGATLCMIGHLQTNKASVASRVFDEVHSIDSTRVAEALSRFGAAYRASAPIPVCVEVNVGNDPAKHGVSVGGALPLVEYVLGAPSLRLVGLMTVAPGYGDPEIARHAFRSLRELRDSMIEAGVDRGSLRELSMGMSGDFDIAIEEGSTLIRLGTALFGPRP